MKLLDGTATALKIKGELKAEVEAMIQRGERRPHLAAVLIGDNGASLTYVGAKVKACEELGFESSLITRPSSATEEEVLEIVNQLNNDSKIDGYIVQLPLPKHINEQNVLLAIDCCWAFKYCWSSGKYTSSTKHQSRQLHGNHHA